VSCGLAFLFAGLSATLAGAPAASGAGIPSVPVGHPRVYVRASDLPGIRAKLEMPEFAKSWEKVQQGADDRLRGNSGAMCRAFLYLVNGDRDQGRRAIEMALSDLRQCRDKKNGARVVDSPVHEAACVYDWCYALLTPEEKKAFVAEFERIAALHPPWYPAVTNECLAVVGHDSEGWLLTGQLPVGVAIYDEAPTMYDAAARLFVDKYIPPRNYHYASHSHHQGSHYGTRLVYDLAAAWLFRRMGAGDVFSRDQQYVPYPWIYCLRPDGQQIQRGENSYTGRSGRKRINMNLAATYYEDPILEGMAQCGYFDAQCSPMEEVFDLLFRPAGLATRPMSELPTVKFFPEPMGEMAARTGWTMGPDSRDVIVYMRAGGTFFGNHQKRDMGTFQIYYRGPLAISSGYYGPYGDAHWRYSHETLASNGLLIFDPNERLSKKQINSGGQIIPNDGEDHPIDLETIRNGGYEQGDVTAHAFGPDSMRPEYAFIAGDITRAYGAKAGLVARSMATLFTGDARYPAILVLFDRMVAAQPEFRKTWLMHTVQEPAIEGNGATVSCDNSTTGGIHRGGGKLDLRSFLPEDAEIRKIGGPGREFWVDSPGTNYAIQKNEKSLPTELAAWRVEISPKQARRDDEFLTALTVMDVETEATPPVRRLEGSNVVGVAILDRAVLFNRGSEPARGLSFIWQGGDDSRILVCGLAGGGWRVTCDGRAQHELQLVPTSAGSLYLRGGAGRYVLECVEPGAKPLARVP
jgi:heparin/heparan-sulfate lyase